MRARTRIPVPAVIVAAALVAALGMILVRPEPETIPPEAVLPVVRYATVEPRSGAVVVRSQGTVAPRTESMLVPEVSGRVASISSSLAAGGFFEEGDVLIRLDPRDYELAVIGARARVAQARSRLAIEEEEAASARREWDALGRGTPSPLVLREPQLVEARAALDAARAALERAERDLGRTTIRAPFAGRVRDKRVDVGQVVSPGAAVATLYSVDVAEVRLPVPDRELAFLDLPLGREVRDGPRVTLEATFAGEPARWEGRIVRTVGEIDPASRMVHLVAAVADPYAPSRGGSAVPLAVGMFVRAEIHGRRLDGVVALPRAALRADDRVLVLDRDDRLRYRRVAVLRTERDVVLVGAGLAAGERVSVSPLDVAVDGMKVRAVADEAWPEARP